MGRRGPAPKPTALRVLHGDRKDRVNTDEPVPPAVGVDRPQWLTPKAVDIWERLAPGMESRGVLTVWDTDALAALCEALAEYQEATALIGTSGYFTIDPRTGTVQDSPAVKFRDRADTKFQRWAARFGMTPSDRAQVKVGAVANDVKGAERLLS